MIFSITLAVSAEKYATHMYKYIIHSDFHIIYLTLNEISLIDVTKSAYDISQIDFLYCTVSSCFSAFWCFAMWDDYIHKRYITWCLYIATGFFTELPSILQKEEQHDSCIAQQNIYYYSCGSSVFALCYLDKNVQPL